MTLHDVVYSQTQHGETRFICRTCNGADIIWYPFKSDEQWSQEYQAFRKKHPHDEAPDVRDEKPKRERKSWWKK